MLLAEDVASINLYAEPTVIGLYERLGFQKARLLTAQPCQASIVQQSVNIACALCPRSCCASRGGACRDVVCLALCPWMFEAACGSHARAA